jgi:hypothetical protein
MYIRVTHGRMDPAKVDEHNQLMAEVVAVATRLPGCRSFSGGVDRARGQSITVSTWDTEENARWSRDALGDIIPRLQALGVQLEPPEVFEAIAT